MERFYNKIILFLYLNNLFFKWNGVVWFEINASLSFLPEINGLKNLAEINALSNPRHVAGYADEFLLS